MHLSADRPRRRARLARGAILAAMLAGLSACAVFDAKPGGPGKPSFTQVGMASWYGKAHDRHRTASGERFDMRAMTAAHRTLDFDTVVRVTNLENGRTVKVRINDRGPYIRGRIIDLSSKAASTLDMKEDGEARVRLEIYAEDQTEGD
ncbi:MAG TPA: septal ring lytic transglycosylase RlpA family protein [Stellaceae bacterium]